MSKLREALNTFNERYVGHYDIRGLHVLEAAITETEAELAAARAENAALTLQLGRIASVVPIPDMMVALETTNGLVAYFQKLTRERDAYIEAFNEQSARYADDVASFNEVIASLTRERDEARKDADKANHKLVDKYRDPKTGWFDFPTDVGKIIRLLETERDEARNKALDEVKWAYIDWKEDYMHSADLRPFSAVITALKTKEPSNG